MRYSLSLIAILLLTSCATKQPPIINDNAPAVYPKNLEFTPDAVPRVEPKSRGGNRSSYEVFGKTYHVQPSSEGFTQRGIASWYGTKFHGNKTANGEVYNMYAMTAAHKTLPLPSYVEVTNLSNGKKIIVRVNDRGPFYQGRIIDLSYAAATKLGTLKSGTTNVEIKAINPRLKTSDAPTKNLTALTKIQTTISNEKNSPASPSRTNNTNTVFIQVGAFQSLDNANKLKHELTTTLNSFVSIKPSSSHDDALFLVRVGPYTRIENADLVKLRLQKLGFYNINIVYTKE